MFNIQKTLEKISSDYYTQKRYLPTAFDDSLSLTEKVNSLIHYLFNYQQITEEMLIKWNEVYSWVLNEGLDESINDRLKEWLESGRLQNIIDEILLSDKVSKKEFEDFVNNQNNKLDDLIGVVDGKLESFHSEVENTVNEITDLFNNFKVEIKDELDKMRIWLSPQEIGYINDRADYYIQESFKKSNFIYIPEGIYEIKERITIPKNIHIKLHPNAILLRKHDKGIFDNYDNNAIGYDGNGGITIEGGTLDMNGIEYNNVASCISIVHGTNILIKNLTIKDTPKGHAIEINSCKNVVVDNVKFLGYNLDGSTNTYVEAIQIEGATPPPPNANYEFPYVQDYTESKNITVKNCLFDKSDKLPSFPCGVGQHGARFGLFYDDITVENCEFIGHTYWAIRPFKMRNVTIRGNKIRDCRQGIYIVNPSSGLSIVDKNNISRYAEPLDGFIVSDNFFDGITSTALFVEGKTNAKIRSIIISNNVFKNVGNIGIYLQNSTDVIIDGNVLEGVSTGSRVTDSERVNFFNNVFQKIDGNGIFLLNTRNSKISDNNIFNIGYHGININGECSLIDIVSNKVTDCSQRGNGTYNYITLSNGARIIRVLLNTLIRDKSGIKPRYGLLVSSQTINVFRFGNLVSVNAEISNIGDNSNSISESNDYSSSV